MSTKRLNALSGLTNERRLSEGRTLPETGESRSACPVRDIVGSVGDRVPERSNDRLRRPVSNGACHSFFLGMSRHGQQVAEYSLLIAAISAALLAMYIYAKRGLQGTIKGLTDHEIGWQNDSVPILAAGAHQMSNSTLSTVSHDRMNIKKDPDFGTQYEFTSTSYATGEGNATYNEF